MFVNILQTSGCRKPSYLARIKNVKFSGYYFYTKHEEIGRFSNLHSVLLKLKNIKSIFLMICQILIIMTIPRKCHEKIDPPTLSHTDLMQTMGRFNVTPY